MSRRQRGDPGERIRTILLAAPRPRRHGRRAPQFPPRTGKRLEIPIKKLIQGADPGTALNRATVANADVLDWYVTYARNFRHPQQAQEQAERTSTLERTGAT